MPAGVTVRPAQLPDLTSIARIYNHYVLTSLATFDETPPGDAEWRTRLGDLAARRLPFLVASAYGDIVGYAYCAPWRHRPAYRHTAEDSVYVAPEAAGRGVGRELLAELLEHAVRAEVRQVIAVIADAGTAAPPAGTSVEVPAGARSASVTLHRRFGFTAVGRLTGVGYKHGRWLDTLLYQRALP